MRIGLIKKCLNLLSLDEYGDYVNCLSKEYLAKDMSQHEIEADDDLEGEHEENALFEVDPLSIDESSGSQIKIEGNADDNCDDFDMEEVHMELFVDPDRSFELNENYQDQEQTENRSKGEQRTIRSRSSKLHENLTCSSTSSSTETEHGLKLTGRKGRVTCKCGKKYSRIDCLRRHLTETSLKEKGEKFVCKICFEGKPSKLVSYMQACKLKDHVQVVHQGKRIECPICGDQFTSRSLLYNHRRKTRCGKI